MEELVLDCLKKQRKQTKKQSPQNFESCLKKPFVTNQQERITFVERREANFVFLLNMHESNNVKIKHF